MNTKQTTFTNITRYFEKVVWSMLGIWVFYYTSLFVLDFISKEEYLYFLGDKVFWVIIGVEVIKIVILRLLEKSHTYIAYHFTLMMLFTFAREIVLKHNLDIWVVFGAIGATLVVVITYFLKENSQKSID